MSCTTKAAQLGYSLLGCIGLCLVLRSDAATTGCGGVLTNDTGSFWTPNYPNNYPNGIECIWLIKTGISRYIEATIDDFDVEPFRSCKTDKLEIKDGGNKYSPMIGMTSQQFHDRVEGGQYCNSSPAPRIVTSSSNLLRFWFHSDSRDSFRGFFISYRTIKEEPCGGTLPSSNSIIYSPRYPLPYPSNTVCSWLIKSPPGKFIHLQFLDFQMEFICKADGKCQCADWVQIQDGKMVIGSYCFSSPSTFVSSSSELRLKFWTGPIGRSRGFKAIVSTSSTAGCGGDFLARNGTFITPNFAPLAQTTYPAFSDCVWTITAPRDHYVSLHFTYLDVVSIDKTFCIGDYIEVRDGGDNMAALVGLFCNSNSPQVLLSTKMSLYIKFHSDGRDHGKGFQAKFKTHRKSCGESLGMEDGRLRDGLLTASSYLKVKTQPQIYAASNGRLHNQNSWCSQEQKPYSTGEYFQVEFPRVTKLSGIATQGHHLVAPYNHSQYVTKYRIRYSIGNGIWRDYKLLKNLNDSLPFTVFSGGKLWQNAHLNQLSPPIVARIFRLYPLDYVTGTKKHICLRSELYGCPLDLGDGHVLSSSRGSFSFNSSTTEPAAINQWVIAPPPRTPNTYYHVQFKQFAVDCSEAKVTISHDPLGDGKSEYCGKERPPHEIYSAYQPTWVEVRSMAAKGKRKVISVTYTTEDLGLGRIHRAPSGTISASVMPSYSGRSLWFIILPVGSRIDVRLDVTTMSLLPSGACADYLEIKDGLMDDAPSLGRFCSTKSASPLVSRGHQLRIEFFTQNKYTLQTQQPRTAPFKGGHHGFRLTYTRWKRKLKPTASLAEGTAATSKTVSSLVTLNLGRSDATSDGVSHHNAACFVLFLALAVLLTNWA